MAIFNSFTFDNENSLDSGIYITGEAVFNAPKRVVEMVNVPGRNGAIAIDEGRFENIPVKYPAGCFADNMADFAEKVANFRNILASRFTYKRLEDTYYPDEFRMGLYRSGLEVDVVNQARAGKFDIEFDCKPQRFLKSGEIPVEYTPGQTPSDEQTKTGSIVTIEAEEGTIISDVKADINPVQDLHGYDKPWIGGAGKNKIDVVNRTESASVVSLSTYMLETCSVVKTGGTYKATSTGPWSKVQFGISGLKENQTYTFSALFSNPSGGRIGMAYLKSGTWADTITSTAASVRLKITFTYTSDITILGLIVNNTNASTGYEVTMSEIQLEEGSSQTTYEPYSNICPISGWDSVKVTRTGKNLLNPTLPSGTSAGVTATRQSDKSYRLTGTATSTSVNIWIAGGFITNVSAQLDNFKLLYLKAGTVVTFKDCRLYFYDVETGKPNDTFGYRNVPIGSDAMTLTVPHNAWLTGVRIPDGVNGTAYNTTLYPQIELGSTATDYEPYQGNTYTIDLNGTRYGGTLDVTSGVLTVTHRHITENDFASVSSGTSAGGLHYIDIPKTDPAAISNKGMSNMLAIKSSGWTSATPCFSTNTGSSPDLFPVRVYADATSLADFKTKFSGLQIVYELATPITVRLTRTEVKALLGVNNVWADSGDITVKYGTSPYIIVNPTDFPSKPLLEVTGVGSFWLGDTQITITGTSGQIIYIDCETGECYKVTGGIISPANGLVTLNRLDFPKLASGINNIQLGSGISKVKITPRWWRL